MKLITDFTLAVTPSDEEGNLCLELVEPATAEVLEHHVRVLRRVSVGDVVGEIFPNTMAPATRRSAHSMYDTSG